ncbi:MAG: T9SS type A sorting domain-containing protein [Saprospiraceae bacterium]|nr:T9SS type A sorting domain-containing protein [Saprospiraceae bacterium]
MKSTLTFIFLFIASLSFALNITVNPTTAPCGTTIINGNTGCNHNGTLQISVAGNPSGVSISNVTAITGGNFTFNVMVTPSAPAAVMLNVIIITSDDPTGCALPNATGVVNMGLQCSCNIQLNGSSTNESCFGCNNGTATVSVTGGADPVTFNWSNGASGSQIVNLTQGTYTVTATDANGCTASAAFNVFPYECSAFSVTSTVTNEQCHDDCNGSIQLGPLSNGSTAYTVSWNEGQSATFLGDLCAATYLVTVSDNDNCTATAAFQVTQPPLVEIIIDNIIHATDIAGGQVFLTINSGGLELTNCEMRCTCICFCGICGDIVNNTMTVDNLEPANYTLYFKDSNGCEYTSDTFEIQNLSSTKELNFLKEAAIFPNPSNDKLNIINVDEGIHFDVQIYNNLGIIMKKFSNQNEFKLDQYPTGLYYVVLKSEGEIRTLKFIKSE